MLAALADVDAIVNTTQHATTIRNQGAHARICGDHAPSQPSEPAQCITRGRGREAAGALASFSLSPADSHATGPAMHSRTQTWVPSSLARACAFSAALWLFVGCDEDSDAGPLAGTPAPQGDRSDGLDTLAAADAAGSRAAGGGSSAVAPPPLTPVAGTSGAQHQRWLHPMCARACASSSWGWTPPIPLDL
jgi:hypothetical protein